MTVYAILLYPTTNVMSFQLVQGHQVLEKNAESKRPTTQDEETYITKASGVDSLRTLSIIRYSSVWLTHAYSLLITQLLGLLLYRSCKHPPRISKNVYKTKT